MVANPMVTHITAVQKAVWPEVKRASDLTMASIADLAQIDLEARQRVEAYLSRDGVTKRAKICSETIWALARMGYLRTGQEAAVIKAAREWVEWVDCPEIASDEQMLELEDNLIESVRSLTDYGFNTEE